MEPFEELYGRPCRSPVCWTKIGERSIFGPDLVRETTKKVQLIQQRLLTAHSRQKSYADKRRRPLEFIVGDFLLLKVSPNRGVKRFGKKGKLSPRYIGLFQIIRRVGAVSYQLELPQRFEHVHDTFHVSMLRKYERDPSYAIDPSNIIAWEDLEIQEDATYVERSVRILDFKEHVLRTKTIPMVKVQWQRRHVEEAT
ncbi:uncharacterized protein LOC113360497 [Papaver somniferum]|uniref:uncharacterized protein LOC113360497 n=1 Tax=Papaver somniferum TaxID=3469 RepID=UPI000E704F55|nr:uncharacterized protein LOC113360497 [Papaver somniferum]